MPSASAYIRTCDCGSLNHAAATAVHFTLQRYIIRLIFMVPVYAVGSWFSLKYRASAIYFDTVRDWWVLHMS